MRSFKLALWLIVLAVPCSSSASAQCTQYTPHVLFPHDTYGYAAANSMQSHIRGPSRPCESMKAVTEAMVGPAALPRTSYFGVRLVGVTTYSSSNIDHGDEITVGFTHLSHAIDVPASLTADFTFWELLCTLNHGQMSGPTFHLPLPCPNPPPPPPLCSSYGSPIIKLVVGDEQWEQPELVRIRMDTASSPINPSAGVTTQSYRAGWVVQDEFESGALFKYPVPLPAANSAPGLTVQLATSLAGAGGFSPDFNGVSLPSHVGQNNPYAASEVVAETSWLEFAIALLDENGARGGVLDEYDIAGNFVHAPAPLQVTFEFLDREDWSPMTGSVNPPQTWLHYATQGSQQDFVIERYDLTHFDPLDPASGWVLVQQNAAGESTVTIPTTLPSIRLRFRSIDNDSISAPATIEVAHLHIKHVEFTAAVDPSILRIGWSSDFRFLIQDNHNCPE